MLPPPHPHVIWAKGVLRAEWVILTKLSMKLEREREYTHSRVIKLIVSRQWESSGRWRGCGVMTYGSETRKISGPCRRLQRLDHAEGED
jgi:hypothetical protein